MEDNLIYHRVEVQNSKDQYQEFDTLDFLFNVEGRALKANSVRLNYKVAHQVKDGGSFRKLTTTDDVFTNERIAGHIYFQSVNLDFQSIGQVEHIPDYPRYYVQVDKGTRNINDCWNGTRQAFGQTATRQQNREYLAGEVGSSSGGSADKSNNPDYVLKPLCAINRMSNDVSFSKTGQIRLSIHLNRNSGVFQGVDQDADTRYLIEECFLTFQSVPDVNANVSMNAVYGLKSVVNSQFSNTSAKVPAVCDSVVCSFLKQTDEYSLVNDNYRLDLLPEIDEIQFLFSDSTSKYIQYIITDRGEMIEKFLEAMRTQGNNQMNSQHFGIDFGLGLSFPPVDLSNQKFNIQITNSNNTISSTPYIIYMYFHSLVNL
jgi:hypothetical protein